MHHINLYSLHSVLFICSISYREYFVFTMMKITFPKIIFSWLKVYVYVSHFLFKNVNLILKTKKMSVEKHCLYSISLNIGFLSSVLIVVVLLDYSR